MTKMMKKAPIRRLAAIEQGRKKAHLIQAGVFGAKVLGIACERFADQFLARLRELEDPTEHPNVNRMGFVGERMADRWVLKQIQ